MELQVTSVYRLSAEGITVRMIAFVIILKCPKDEMWGTVGVSDIHMLCTQLTCTPDGHFG